MNCDRMDGLLDRLMDGELTEEERLAMEAHGRECPACAEAISATMQMKALLAGMDTEADVPLQAQGRWRSAVKAEATAMKKRRMIRWIASAAAAVVAVAGVGLFQSNKIAPDKSAVPLAMEEAIEAEGEDEAAGRTLAAPEAVMASDDRQAGKAVINSAAAPVGTAVPVYETDKSAGEAAEYSTAGSAVVEADGSAESDIAAPEAEANGMEDFEQPGETLACAAVAQRAPACELTLRVENVETACHHVSDLVEEYEGTADIQAQADGGADIYVEIAAENADDFLNAVLPLDISDGKTEPPELSAEGSVLLLLTINP